MKICDQSLENFDTNKTGFVCRFITTDETWTYNYTPESKQQSKQRTVAGCSAPKYTRRFRQQKRLYDVGLLEC